MTGELLEVVVGVVESWRDVVGYEGLYQVSDGGRVRTLGREGVYPGRWKPTRMVFPAKEMRVNDGTGGYRYVKLKRPNSKSKHELVHRLVMAAFVGPANGMQVNHLDGNRSNNHISNLEYCTSLQNVMHAIEVLETKVGNRIAVKIRDEDVPRVIADTRPIRAIAEEFGVTYQAVWAIKNGVNRRYAVRKDLERRASANDDSIDVAA
jgi:hypothetical protein